jgi:hypothetical protein
MQNWKLADDVLHWLDRNVQRGQRTLETGCGYSTILFALKGTRHTVISPIVEEHQRIRQWCKANGIDLSNVEFKLGRSEDLLPALKPEPLDLVLIDGWHAFPAPFLDWFFTAKGLVINGYVLVDDTQLKTPRILRDFLETEQGRWELVTRFKRTDIFRKVSRDVFIGEWHTQPYGAKPYLSIQDRVRSLATVARRATTLTRTEFAKALKLFPPLYRVCKAARNWMSANDQKRR